MARGSTLVTLRPNATTQKALVSTTSRMVGEYDADGILVTHAWPDFYDQAAMSRMVTGLAPRSALVCVFETSPTDTEAGSPVPDYSSTGFRICSYLSLLFGKRFDHHGMIEHSGFFHVPDLAQFAELSDRSLPHNSDAPRVDFGIPLDLTEVVRIRNLLTSQELDQRFLRIFQSACKFYLRSLQNAEHDPEVAYLHLVTAGEILSSWFEFQKEALLDDQTAGIVSRIRTASSDGPELADSVLTRLLQLKKRFVCTLLRLVDSEFFGRSEAFGRLPGFEAGTFPSVVAAAYDLRSRYVHTGIPFGTWVSLRIGGLNNELQVGKPVVNDSDFGKMLAAAPTYIGLERILRYCLLRFSAMNGAYVTPRAPK